MLIRFSKYFILAVLPSLLAACVSAGNHLQFISNSHAASRDLQACEASAFMGDDVKDALPLNPENISLLNWNIYKGDGGNWQKDLSSFAKDHDLMTIQEAALDEELTGLLEIHDFNWIMNTAFYLNGTAAGVMNVATSNAIHSCGFKVNEPLIRVPKSALVSYYVIDGSKKRLLVANIHGINFTLGISQYRQQLAQLYHSIKHHDGPMIVAGDFNSWTDERMSEVKQLLDKLSLAEIEYTVNNKTHVFGKAIDHVFYRQLELVSNQVWQVSSSDHNPISVNFRYQEVVF